MNTEVNEVTINNVDYIRKDLVNVSPAKNTDGLDYVIIRSRDSGVHAGYAYDVSEDSTSACVELHNSRRLYYWDGAATLSQLSQEGVKLPDNCKFTQAIPVITVYGVCEVIPASVEAQKNIEAVPVWKR